MKRQLCILAAFASLGMGSAPAQTPPPRPATEPIHLTMTDGRVLSASTVRRSKDTLLATVTMGNGLRGEIGYPIATIKRLEFPEPPQIASARTLLAAGKPADALKQIQPVVFQQSDLRTIPGNYWAPAAMIQVDALIALHQDRIAETLIKQLAASSKDPDLIQSSEMALATISLRTGQPGKAVPVFDQVIGNAKSAAILARAWNGKGDALFAQGDFDGALLAYLRVPIFYSNETSAMPAALLGSARAYAGLGEVDSARAAIAELNADFASAPEATQARKELDQLNRKSPSTEVPATN